MCVRRGCRWTGCRFRSIISSMNVYEKHQSRNRKRTEQRYAFSAIARRATTHPRGIKMCRSCRVEKSLGSWERCGTTELELEPSAFAPDDSRWDGWCPRCRECDREHRKKVLNWRTAEERRQRSHLDGRKICRACKETKNVTEFGKDASRSDGYNPRCRACAKDYERNRRNRRKITSPFTQASGS